MANNQANPLTMPLTMLKQMGEQTSAAIQSIGSGLTQTASQGIDAMVSGMPALPGVPGAAGAGAGLPTPQQLMPANLQQALGQIENVLIPAGLPKPSQALKQTTTKTPAAETKPAANAGAKTTTPGAEPSGAQPMRRRVMERRGL